MSRTATRFPVASILRLHRAALRKSRLGHRTAAAAGLVQEAHGLLDQLWTRAQPSLSILSAAGWASLATLTGALVTALAVGWRELWAAAFVLAILLLVAALFLLGGFGYDVSLDLASTRVVVGDQAVGRVWIRNRGSRPIGAASVRLPVGAAFAQFDVPRLGRGEEMEELFTIPTHRRAVLRLGPVEAVKSDPVGLLRRVRRLSEPAELFVHPKTVSLAGGSAGLLRDLEGLATLNLSADDVSFHALREYVPGDDRRHIHWKSTARAQQLMVRQYEETRRSQTAILLATRTAEYASGEEFETAVGVAASIGVQALADGKEVLMLGPRRSVLRRTRNQLLDGLAGVQMDELAQAFEEQAGRLAGLAPGASIVVLVAGSGITQEQLGRASGRLPLASTCIAVRVDPAGAVTRRKISDLILLTIPDLSDLARALRRAIA